MGHNDVIVDVFLFKRMKTVKQRSDMANKLTNVLALVLINSHLAKLVVNRLDDVLGVRLQTSKHEVEYKRSRDCLSAMIDVTILQNPAPQGDI